MELMRSKKDDFTEEEEVMEDEAFEPLKMEEDLSL